MSASPVDPIVRLEHDHSHLSSLVASLRDCVRRGESAGTMAGGGAAAEVAAELSETLRLVNDDLCSHFAREEEGLFPTVVQELPDLEPRVAGLVRSHDLICGAVSRMVRIADSGAASVAAEFEGFLALFHRFDEAYVAHSKDERDLLRLLAERLDPAQRVRVERILRGL